MVNGFVGDPLVRGTIDAIDGKYQTECSGDLADILQQKHLFTCFSAFRKSIAARIRLRSRVPMEDAVRKWAQVGKLFACTNFYYRQRCYTSNNFLQHRELAEALLPFYSWSLFAYKMQHDDKVFSRTVYQRIFQKYFPEVSTIPHASDLPTNKRKHTVSRHTRKWARQMFPLMFSRERLAFLPRAWGIPIDLAGIMGLYRVEDGVLLLERLYLLEKRVRDAGLHVDWDAI